MGLKEVIEGLEKFIPGISGYKEKELLREESLRVREIVEKKLSSIKDRLTSKMRMLLLEGWDPTVFEQTVIRRLERLTAYIRSAEAGYAGVFDHVNVKEDLLTQILEKDKEILEIVEEMEKLEDMNVDKWVSMLDRVEKLIKERKELLKGVM